MFAIHGTACWICHHEGATEADHMVPTTDPALYYDVANLRPAHGVRRRCPVCHRACNQQRPGRKHDGIPGARVNGNGKPPEPAPRINASRQW